MKRHYNCSLDLLIDSSTDDRCSVVFILDATYHFFRCGKVNRKAVLNSHRPSAEDLVPLELSLEETNAEIDTLADTAEQTESDSETLL